MSAWDSHQGEGWAILSSIALNSKQRLFIKTQTKLILPSTKRKAPCYVKRQEVGEEGKQEQRNACLVWHGLV